MKAKIGIDCQKILNPGTGGAGIEHYTWHLVRSLASHPDRFFDLVLFVKKDISSDPRLLALADQPGVSLVDFPQDVLERKSWWPFTKYKRLSRFFASQNLDILHGPANVTTLFYQGKTVVTVHDLIIYEHPEWFPGGLSDIFWRHFLVPRAIKNAGRVVAVSKYTKNQVVSRFGIDPEEVDVIYEGVTVTDTKPDETILAKNNISQPYFLYVGTIEPRKNLPRVIAALARLRKTNPEIQLVIAGKKGWKVAEVFATVKKLQLESNVKFCGYVSDEEKQALYKNALAFVFPSLAEGFGLPVLDAMQSGVPVLTSNGTSLVEVAGDAALQANPYSVEEISAGLKKIAEDKNLRLEMTKQGKAQAQKFTWSQAAQKTIDTYKKVLDGKV